MMRSGSALAVAVATLLVCCSAVPHRQEQESEHSGERFDTNDHKTRNLDPLGGGHLVRGVREVRPPGWLTYMAARKQDYSPYGTKHEVWPMVPAQYSGYYAVGLPKRNFDEIDRSALDNFVRKRNFDEIDQTSMPFSKRNFDEIDQTSMPFPYATKRFVHVYGPRLLGPADIVDQRNRLDYPMD